MADRHITTSSGHRMGLTAFGDPIADRLVVMFHPMPGAGNFDPSPDRTHHWGVHVIAPDRPGYGASDPIREGELASFARHAQDVAAYLRSVEQNAQATSDTNFGTVGVIGWGVGGLPAASLAAQHPATVDRLALIDVPKKHRPGPMDPPFRLSDLGVAVDDAAIDVQPGVDRRLLRMLEEAGQQGCAGVDFDRSALRNPDWKQLLGEIRAETLLIYGNDSPLANAATDGAKLRRRIPPAQVVRVEGAGSLAIATVWERILAHVAPHHGWVPHGLEGWSEVPDTGGDGDTPG